MCECSRSEGVEKRRVKEVGSVDERRRGLFNLKRKAVVFFFKAEDEVVLFWFLELRRVLFRSTL